MWFGSQGSPTDNLDHKWRSHQPHNFAQGHAGVSAIALFWHFVDGLWIVLFILVYLLPSQ
ncbi:MAG: cytochrome c oxidase subunit 3 [Synechocystis sp.]